MRSTCVALLTFGVCLLYSLGPAARPARAQAATTGVILGTVTDQSGAVVPGADVVVTEVATGVKHTTKSDAEGRYEVLALPSNEAHMTVTVSKAGFQTFVSRDVVIDPSAHVQINATLQVGTGTMELTVTATAVQVNTQSGESSGVIAGDEVSELQLNGRDWRDLSALIPGINDLNAGHGATGVAFTSGNNMSVNGLDTSQNMYTTDGAYNMNTGSMGNENVLQPIDSISEFKVIKDNYSARYGFLGGAQFMVATKSGTKVFHGNAYDYIRNDSVDANNWFNNAAGAPNSSLRQNIFGGSLGGPVYIPGHYNTDRSKTFFFTNEEYRIRHSGVSVLGAIIPQDMRNGNFSHDPTLPTGGLSLDAASAAILANEHPGVTCLTASGTNGAGLDTINANCMDPNSVAMMNHFWPILPNNPAGGFNNYLNTNVERNDGQDYTERIDHRFNDRFALMARISYETGTDAWPYLSWGGNPEPSEAEAFKETGFNNMIQFTANISPTVMNQVTLTQTDDKPRLSISGAAFRAGISPALTINLPFGYDADQTDRAPDISFAEGWSGTGNGGLPINASDQENVVADDFTKIKGGHTIQAGVMLVWGIKRQSNFATTEGSYSFSGVHSGDPVADFLLGMDSSFSQNNIRRRGSFRYIQDEAYGQDDWKVNGKLTINMGVRMVYYSPDTMEGNGVSDFDPARYDPSQAPVVGLDGLYATNGAGVPITASGTPANLLNGIVFPASFKPNAQFPLAVATSGVPDGIFTTGPHFGPRVGFAYDPAGNGKMAIRGGYGLGYGRVPFAIYNGDLSNPGFTEGVTLLNGTVTDPALGIPGAQSAFGINTIGSPNQTFNPLKVQTYSLTVERELIPGGVLTVAYVGSHSNNYSLGYDHNWPVPVGAPTQAGCVPADQNPSPAGGFQFDPCINTGATSATFTRPIPMYNGISGQSQSAAAWPAMANYHALQAGFRFVSHRGITATIAYTWQHTLTNNLGPQDPYNFQADYGQPSQGQHQIFNASYIWHMPFLKNRQDFTGRALGDWTFSGITTFVSGTPNSIGLSTGVNGLAALPNCVAATGGARTHDQWFNTAAFVAPAYGFYGNCSYGNVYGPPLQVWNWALYKTFPIKERLKIQLRFEAFNIWNKTNFQGMDTGLGDGAFGQTTNTADPRQLEGALRISF
jgi:Carboxypeptidase regulatory-like domain/TonB-dependent Receptor Plug Domain